MAAPALSARMATPLARRACVFERPKFIGEPPL
jgi:hypothetical protein